MPFSHVPKNPGDLIKSQDWNEALDAVVALFAKFNGGAGHQHSGSGEDAPPIGTSGIADNAVSTAKIQNAAVTAAKLAAGVIPQIGIAVTGGLSHGQNIPVPAGFAVNECVFFATLNSVPQDEFVKITWDNTGKISIWKQVPFLNQPGVAGSSLASGIAFGKKGGW
ncbi:MAG: hypothetical protein H6577_05830 [Lewinellaceae bacterium]|nr:hypothetical protein [Saprospiraceae bacterium]MCB9337626.1 hypothetical protein [Lewinellaceae bacterium]